MAGRRILTAYAVVATANVLGSAADLRVLANLTKPFLVPLLFAWLLVYTRGRLTRPLRWLAIGLVFAWLGDLLLIGDGDLFFAAGLGGFLLMQLCYIRAFTSVSGPGLVRA